MQECNLPTVNVQRRTSPKTDAKAPEIIYHED